MSHKKHNKNNSKKKIKGKEKNRKKKRITEYLMLGRRVRGAP
jgi:hypothetical protein